MQQNELLLSKMFDYSSCFKGCHDHLLGLEGVDLVNQHPNTGDLDWLSV